MPVRTKRRVSVVRGLLRDAISKKVRLGVCGLPALVHGVVVEVGIVTVLFNEDDDEYIHVPTSDIVAVACKLGPKVQGD